MKNVKVVISSFRLQRAGCRFASAANSRSEPTVFGIAHRSTNQRPETRTRAREPPLARSNSQVQLVCDHTLTALRPFGTAKVQIHTSITRVGPERPSRHHGRLLLKLLKVLNGRFDETRVGLVRPSNAIRPAEALGDSSYLLKASDFGRVRRQDRNTRTGICHLDKRQNVAALDKHTRFDPSIAKAPSRSPRDV